MEFYKKMLETELKNMFFWMANATENTKKGENAIYSLNNAIASASKVNEYRARIDAVDLERGTDGAIDWENVIDWEKLTDWAIKAARAEVENDD